MSEDQTDIRIRYDEDNETYSATHVDLDDSISSISVTGVGETEKEAVESLAQGLVEELSDISNTETTVSFPEAVGTGISTCPDCGGSLEPDDDSYDWICIECEMEFEIQDVSLIFRKEE